MDDKQKLMVLIQACDMISDGANCMNCDHHPNDPRIDVDAWDHFELVLKSVKGVKL